MDRQVPSRLPILPVNHPAIIPILLAQPTIVVATIGTNPIRLSSLVPRFMQGQGYRILPVHPHTPVVLGEVTYPSLTALAQPPALINVFCRPHQVAGVVDDAVACGAQALWFQLGVVDFAAAERARAAGLYVVMNRCIIIEYLRWRLLDRSLLCGR